jgi:Fe-S-cluster containining protein
MPRKSKSQGVNKATKEGKPKFKFVCQLCGKCCGSEEIMVTLPDLERWMVDNTIYRAIHLLKYTEVDGKPAIILKRDDDGKCNLFHRDTKQCTIYETRPLFCQAYPLGFNGEQYYIKNKKCKGLGKEKMSKDELEAIRNSAFEEFVATRQLNNVLPIVYGIIFNKLIEDSQEMMEKMGEAGVGEQGKRSEGVETIKSEDNDETK